MSDSRTKNPKDEKAERLNAALRANLQRRKAAARRPDATQTREGETKN
ncbi:hypothetical protein [Asticcacaulis sp. AND118]|nr:hypothetical protein [Asticcacaulis sp. AND118]UDF02604.1 hypothetical protein LH365_09170 [Asticcacaulis sp. AND118]